MNVGQANVTDVDELVNLRVAYLTEDNGELDGDDDTDSIRYPSMMFIFIMKLSAAIIIESAACGKEIISEKKTFPSLPFGNKHSPTSPLADWA